ncbi:MAG: ABC transporter substrate-binding protein [Rhodospirillum sp.]|nr:ABC transporter substrate-binding protein [Rhodospirillum sp.]MCF8489681.1 ABC transporter substrate-binding protein [Rhodospirillum sp.]
MVPLGKPATPPEPGLGLAQSLALSLALSLSLGFALTWIPGVDLGLGGPNAQAAEFRWTAPASLPNLDPHALPSLAEQGLIGQVYDSLVERAPDLSLRPALAEAWEPVTATRWRFHLRRGVLFHDGSRFDADDVVASLERAMATSETQGDILAPLYRIRRMDDTTVDIYTHDPVGDLPDRLTLAPIMENTWLRLSNPKLQANGTGPFKVESFTPNGPLTLTANADWWGGPPTTVTRATLYPTPRARDRLRFLLEDRVDLAQDLDPEMMEPLGRTPGVIALRTLGPRVLMLGMNQSRPNFLSGTGPNRVGPIGPGKSNPFRDPRVREAVLRAIDAEAINQDVLSGQAAPAALIAAPVITGFPQALNIRPTANSRRAKALLAEAGVPETGFAVTLDCPAGHYLRDTLICGEVADALTAVGIRVTVNSMTPEAYFSHILTRKSDFYLLGWLPNTLEIGNPILNLAACPPDMPEGVAPPPGPGALNLGGFCDTQVNRLIPRMTSAQHRPQRDAAAAEILMRLRDTVAYVPLIQQPVLWGTRNRVQIRQRADGVVDLRTVILDPESPPD